MTEHTTGPSRRRAIARVFQPVVFALAVVTSTLTYSLVEPPTPVAAELPSVSTDTAFASGAYIVDMGQSADPSVDLLPYGLIYELIRNQQIPVYWAIRSDKVKDGTVDEIDFSVDGTDYRGGAFIIPAEFVAEAMPTITTYQGMGVKIDGPVSAFEAPLFSRVSAWPKAVLDADKGSITAAYYANAGIPTDSYRLGLPTELSNCDDLYVMPHADPEWSTHSNLVTFNEGGGYIWAACHAVSVLENVDDPASADPAPDMNFLSVNGLIDFGDHDGGDGIYDYNAPEGGDPIFQFIGRIDSATENGSEQIYLPAAGGWRPTTKVLVWDDNHPEVPTPSPGEAAKLVYGRGFGDETNGMVMYEGGHSHTKGDGPDVVAAQRAFFNLHLLAGIERGISVDVNTPETIGGGETVTVSAVIDSGSNDYDWEWSSTCGGAFADPTGSGAGSPVNVSTTFTAPAGAGDCTIRLFVTDTCNRFNFDASATEIVEYVDLGLTKVDDVDPAEAGSVITYTLTVTNAGPGNATNTIVTDILPPEVDYLSAAPSQGTCSFLGSVECNLGTITPATTATIDVRARIKSSASGTITNTASVSADQPDTDPSDNTATESTLTGRIGLTLDKSASPAFLDAAGNVTYTFLVGNDGPNDLTSVVLTDDQCAPLVRGADQIGDDDDTLEPGEVWEFNCVATVSTDTTNTATVTATDPLLGTISATDSAFVDVIAPSISIAKGPETQDAPENGEAVFDITVTNDGDVDLTDIFVTDPLAPTCERFLRLLTVGESYTYECSLAVGAAGSSGTNTIEVTASDPGGEPVTATDTADWTVIPSDLRITKTNDATGPLVPGDTVTYTIEVQNTGSTTQNDVVVTDILPLGFDWVSTTVTRGLALVEDDFSRDVQKRYPIGWIEWNDNTPSDRTAGDIKFVNCVPVSGNTDDCNLILDQSDNGVYQAIDLTGVTDIDVTFDWAVQKTEDGTGTFTLALWNGTTWQPVPGATYTLTAVGGFTTVTVSNIDPSSLGADIATGRIGFITAATNTGNDEALIDNVSITWSGGTVEDQFLDPDKDYYAGWQESGGTDKFGGDARVYQTSTDATCNINDECVLRLNNKDVDVYWPADLTGVTSVDVTFDWSTLENDLDGGESFDLVVWDGLAWQSVATYPLATSGLPSGFTTVTETFDPSALGGDIIGGRIGFLTPSTNDGNDTIYLDNISISTIADVAGNPSPSLVTATDDVDIPAGGTVSIEVVVTIDPTLTVFYPLDQVNTAASTSDETTTPVRAASAVEVVVPGVDIVKTASPVLVSPGETVTYTMVVTNTGNDPVTPSISDPDCGPITLVSGDTANPGVLDLLETWTYTCSTSTPVLTNTATVTATDSLGNPVAPASDSATIDIVDSDIAVTKTADPLQIRTGEEASYTYEVTTGTSGESLTSVFLTDDSCSPTAPVLTGSTNVGDTNADGLLDPGETWQFTCSTNLTATTTNTVTARGVDRAETTVTDTDTATVIVIDPAIALDKTKIAPADPVPAGATVTYGFAVSNPGNDVLSGVTLTDNFCSPLVFAGGDTNGNTLLEPGEIWNYTCDSVVDIDTLNVAAVSATDSLGGRVSANDQLFVDVFAAELRLGKVASPTVVNLGGSTTYTYKVFNAGDTNFFDFAGTAVLFDDTCSPLTRIADLVGDDDIDLEPGESWRYECTSTIGGDVTNTFTAQGVDEFGETVLAEPATQFVAALDPQFAVIKTADQTIVTAGTPVTYTYELTHTGTIPTIFNAITVTGISDDTCSPVTFLGGDTDGDGELSFDIDPASPTYGQPETWTYSCTSTITTTTTNTVTVTGTDTLGSPISSATDTETVSVSDPDFTLVKTAGNAGDGEVEYLEAAGPVTFTYVIENTGADPLTNVTIVDSPVCSPITLVSGDTANPGVFDPGETWTYECTQTVSADQTNTVTVTGTDLLDNPVQRTDAATVDIVAPEVTLAKTSYVGDDAGASCPGDALTVGDPADDLTYCFTVTNTGDTHLDDVAVADVDLGITEADMTLASGAFPLAPAATATWYYKTTIAGDLTNTASVSANPTDASGADLPDVSDVSASDTAEVDEVAPALTLAKSVTTGGGSCPGVEELMVGAGQALRYCFVATNTGDTHLDSVVIDDPTLGGVLAVDPDPSTVAPLAPGASVTFTFGAVVGAVDVTNTATASATPTDAGGTVYTDVTAPVSTPDTATVDVVSPGIGLAKTVSWGSGGSCPGGESVSAVAGDTVTYCFVVTNTGDVDLDVLDFDDPVLGIDETSLSPDPVSVMPLAPLASLTFTYETAVGGDLVNTATVSATPVNADGDPVPGAASPTDTDTAAVDRVAPAITIAKTVVAGHDAGTSCPGGDLVTADLGSAVTYCFTVTNTGDTHLADVTIADPDLGITDTDLTVIAGDLFPLAPGGSLRFYYETSFDQVNSGNVFMNTATAAANPTDDAGYDLANIADVSDGDAAMVEANPGATDIAKTVYLGHDTGGSCPGGELVRAGSGHPVTYCFTVTNTGGTYLDSVTIDDAALGIDETALTLLSGSFPLAPGATARYYYETTVAGDLTNTATVTATATDSDGTPTGEADPTDTDTASVDEPSPSVSLDKTVYVGYNAGISCDGDPSLAGGNGLEITYCFTVINTGDTHLDDLRLDDLTLGIDQTMMTLASGTFPLAPGASATWYYQTTVDGDIMNTATVSANPTASDGTDIPALADVVAGDAATVDERFVGIDLSKTVYAGHDGGASCPGVTAEQVGAGQAVTYCFEVINSSTTPTHLDDVIIDDLTLGITQSDMILVSGVFPLAPGASAFYAYETTATSDLVNTADATANPVDAAGDDFPGVPAPTSQAQATVDVVSPGIELAKTVLWGSGGSCPGVESVSAVAGDVVTFCFVVTNTGDVDLDALDFDDPVLGIDETSLSPDPVSVMPLVPGGSVTFTYETAVSGDVTNTATVSAIPVDAGGVPIPGAAAPSDSDTASVDVVAPSVSVAKSVYVGSDAGGSCPGGELAVADAGDDLTYCFTVTNSGDTYLDAVTIADVDLGVTRVDMTLVSGGLPLAPGASATWSYETSVAGDLTNTVSVSANPVDADANDLANIANPTAGDTAEVDEVAPALTLAKSVTTGGGLCPGVEELMVGAGQALTYCFTVTNTGDTHLDSVVIDDPDLAIDQTDMKLITGTLPLAPGSQATWSFDTTATADLMNTATATATPTDATGTVFADVTAPVSAPDTATVDVVSPGIELAKTVSWGSDAGVSCPGDESVPAVDGDTVTYCFTVTNTGDVDLDTIVIDDPSLSGTPTPIGFVGTVLSPGISETFYLEATVSGDVTNTATVSATPVNPAGDPVPGAASPTDTDTAAVDSVAPAVTIAKTVYVGSDAGASCPGGELAVADAGDGLTYCFTVTNTGDTHLDNVALVDVDLTITEADMTAVSGTFPLAPGTTANWFYETRVDGDLANTALVSANPVDADANDLANIANPTGSDTAEVDEVAPALTLAKTVYAGHDAGVSCDGGESLFAGAGAPVTYCFTVTNTGDTYLDSAVILDFDLGVDQTDMTAVSGTLPLAPGSAATWYYETTVAGDLVNTATATATPTDATGSVFADVTAPVSAPDSAEIVQANPAIEIAKTVYVGHDGGAGCAGEDLVQGGAGLLVTYCFEVHNTGDTFLGDLTVEDPDLGATIADMSEVSGDKAAPLAPGQQLTLYIETTIAGDLTNTATAGGTPTDAAGDPVFGATPPASTDEATVEETPVAIDLVKSIYAGHDAGSLCSGEIGIVAAAGDAVTYCFVVTNTSSAPTHLDAVSVGDAALGITEADMSVVSGSTPLAPGASLVLYYETTATGDLVNTAEATGLPTLAAGVPLGGLTPPVDGGTAELVVVNPAIEIVKVVDQALVDPGATVRWTSTVTNTGDAILGNIVFTDESCSSGAAGPVEVTGNGDAYLEPGEVWEYTCDEQVSADRTSGAEIRGEVFWFAPAGGSNVVTPPDNLVGTDAVSASDASVTLVRQIDLAIDKTLDGDLVAGRQGRYTMTVTNQGRDNASDVVLTDDLPAGLSLVSVGGAGWDCTGSTAASIRCQRPALAAGASASMTLDVSVAATATGSVTNVATVSSEQTESITSLFDNTDSASGSIGQPSFLAFTGVSTMTLFGWGSALLMIGGFMVLVARRRRTTVSG